MSKYVACVFDEAKAAYDGARALQTLDLEGSLAVYEGAIISKNEKGVVRVVDWEEDGPIGTVSGMLLGSLVGVLGGPAGMVVGAATGSMGGLLVDAYNAGVNDDFLDDMARELSPGKYAVVADVTEEWTAPLDTRMEELGANVYRSWRIDVEDEQIDRDIEATQREWEDLEEEWSQAVGETKEKLKAKVDAARARLKALDERAKAKMKALKDEVDAKTRKLDAQIAKAGEDMKKKYRKRRDELKTSYEQRIEKLKQAGQLTAQALS